MEGEALIRLIQSIFSLAPLPLHGAARIIANSPASTHYDMLRFRASVANTALSSPRHVRKSRIACQLFRGNANLKGPLPHPLIPSQPPEKSAIGEPTGKPQRPNAGAIDAAIAEIRSLAGLPLSTLRDPGSALALTIIPSALAFLAGASAPSVAWSVRTRCAIAANEAMALLGLCGLQGVPSHAQVALLLAWGGVTGAPHVVTMAAMRSALEPIPTPSASGTVRPPPPSSRPGEQPSLRSWPTPLLIDALHGLAAVYERQQHSEQWWIYSRLRTDAASHVAGPRGAELSRLLQRTHVESPALFYDPAAFIALRKRCVNAMFDELASRLDNAEAELRRAFMERRAPRPRSPANGPSAARKDNGSTAAPRDAARTALAQFGGFGGLVSVCESAVSLRAAAMPRLFTSLASLLTLRAVCRMVMQSMASGGGVEGLRTVPGGTRHAQFSCATGKPLWVPLCPLPAADAPGSGGAAQAPPNDMTPLPATCYPGDLARLMRVLVASSLGGPAAAFACGVLRFMRSDRPSDAACVRAYLDAASASDVARFVQAVARLHHLHLTSSRNGSSRGGVRGTGPARRTSPDAPFADAPVAMPSFSDAAGGELDDLYSDDEVLLESIRGDGGHGGLKQRVAAPKRAPLSEARGSGYSPEIADLIYDGTLRTLPRLADVVSAHLAAASGGALVEGGAPSRLVVPLAQIIMPLRIMCEALGLLQVSISMHC